MTSKRRSLRSDTGSSVVEIVLIAPSLVLVMVFVVLLGRLAMADIDVNTVAHAASRAASSAADPARARAAAERTAATIPRGAACNRRDVKVDAATFKPGGVVRVTIACHI